MVSMSNGSWCDGANEAPGAFAIAALAAPFCLERKNGLAYQK
jgi:hypothetical protein